eukprot:COSAG01_NODE_1238_length_11092_cov_20.966433_4_plen_539_part_00
MGFFARKPAPVLRLPDTSAFPQLPGGPVGRQKSAATAATGRWAESARCPDGDDGGNESGGSDDDASISPIQADDHDLFEVPVGAVIELVLGEKWANINAIQTETGVKICGYSERYGEHQMFKPEGHSTHFRISCADSAAREAATDRLRKLCHDSIQHSRKKQVADYDEMFQMLNEHRHRCKQCFVDHKVQSRRMPNGKCERGHSWTSVIVVPWRRGAGQAKWRSVRGIQCACDSPENMGNRMYERCEFTKGGKTCKRGDRCTWAHSAQEHVWWEAHRVVSNLGRFTGLQPDEPTPETDLHPGLYSVTQEWGRSVKLRSGPAVSSSQYSEEVLNGHIVEIVKVTKVIHKEQQVIVGQCSWRQKPGQMRFRPIEGWAVLIGKNQLAHLEPVTSGLEHMQQRLEDSKQHMARDLEPEPELEPTRKLQRGQSASQGLAANSAEGKAVVLVAGGAETVVRNRSIETVPGDGQCLFNSIDQTQIRDESVHGLRKLVVEWVGDNWSANPDVSSMMPHLAELLNGKLRLHDVFEEVESERDLKDYL